jgi:lipopolysaccharide transport system permease protein
MSTKLGFIALATSLGWQDVKQAYRRSSVGPFWLTLGMAIQIATIGLVFGLIFGRPLQDFLPFLAVSLILWSFISGSISDASMAFVNGASIIRQLTVPQSVHVLRVIWKNTVLMGHNLVIIPVVFLVFLRSPSIHLGLFFPGLVLNIAFLFGLGYCLGVVTARFRDIQQIVTSLLVVMFYVTPVIWEPSLIPGGTAHLLLGLNPLYHFLQVVRLPILGQAPTLTNWGLALLMALLSLLAAYWVANKFNHKVAYWV